MKKKTIIILSVLAVLIIVILLTVYYLRDKNSKSAEENSINQSSTEDTTEDDTDKVTLTEETTNQSYSIATVTYSSDNSDIKVKYPQITGLADTSMESTVNQLIKNNVDERHKYDTLITELNIDETYQVTLNTDEFLSIVYTKRHYIEGNSEHWNTALITITIDLKTGRELKLSDFMAIDEELVQKIKQSTAVTNEALNNGMDKSKVISYIQQRLDGDMLYGLENNNGIFYLTPDSLVIIMGVSYELGEYALIEFPNQYTPK